MQKRQLWPGQEPWRSSKGIFKLMEPRALCQKRSSLGLEPVSRLEYPGHNGQRNDQKNHRHAQAQDNADIGQAVKAPAKSADQVDHRIEQSNGLPEWWQHINGVKAAAKKCERGDDQ